MSEGRLFERRRVNDGTIVGRRVYHVDTEDYLGVAQQGHHDVNGGWLLTMFDNQVVHYFLDEVLVERPRPKPELDLEAPPVKAPPEGTDGIHVYAPGRQERFEAALREGAEIMDREPGVADDEEALPLLGEPVEYPNPRPAGRVFDSEDGHDTEVDVVPAGREMERKWDGVPRARKDDPDTPTGGVSLMEGNFSVASVAEVKAAIDAAFFQADEASGMLRGAIDKLNETHSSLAVATEQSGHDSVSGAQRALLQAVTHVEEALQAIEASKEQGQGYSANL